MQKYTDLIKKGIKVRIETNYSILFLKIYHLFSPCCAIFFDGHLIFCNIFIFDS